MQLALFLHLYLNRNEKLRGFYRGLGSNILRVTPGNASSHWTLFHMRSGSAITFMAYEKIRSILTAVTVTETGEH